MDNEKKNNLKLEDVIEIEFIQKIQDAFCDAFGFAAVTVDKQKTITKPSNFTNFCQKHIRGTQVGQIRCLACNLKGGNDAVTKNAPNIYKCHAGLCDFAVPIMLGDKHIGSILCGQVLTEKPNEDDFRQYAKELNVDEEEYIKALRQVQIIPEKTLHVAAESMWLLANNLSKIAYKNYDLLKKNKQEIALRKIINLLNSTFDYDKILEIVCEEAVKFFDAQRAFVIEATPNNAKIIKDYKISEEIATLDSKIPPETFKEILRFWSKILLNSNETHVYNDVKEANLPQTVINMHLLTGIQAGFSAIIRRRPDFCSVFVVQEYSRKRNWSEDDINFLSILAQQIALSLKQSELYTSLRKQQEREKTLIDNIPFSAWLKDTNGKYLTVNKSYLKNENLKYEDVIGKTDFELYTEEKALPKKLEDEEIIKNRTANRFEEETTVDNKPVFVDVFKSPVFDEFGNIFAIAGLHRDVTDEREIERIKSEFLSIVSHELRTPLTSIRGGLELVINGLTGEIPEKAKNLLTIANKNSLKLLTLINDILDIEKLEAGKMNFYFKDIEIAKTIEKALFQVRLLAKEKELNLKFENQVKEDLISVDEEKLLQILTKILSNAIKFSNNNTNVIIKTENINNEIHISITNFGEKIKKENKEIIFEKFYQEDSSDTRKKGGTGLGLHISRLLVERMNGKISFESDDEKTTFFIVFKNKTNTL